MEMYSTDSKHNIKVKTRVPKTKEMAETDDVGRIFRLLR